MHNVGSLSEMVNSSVVVLTRPSVSSFEMFERRGALQSALIYVGVAAVIAGVLGLVGGLIGLIAALIGAIVNFVVFTGLVFYIGRAQGGTGTFDEVAYTFSLFVAPLIVVQGALTLLSRIPVLGWLASLASLIVAIAEIYFGYLAVQSSMNIRDRTKAIVTLVLAGLAAAIIGIVITAILV